MYKPEIKIGNKLFVRIDAIVERLGYNPWYIRLLARKRALPAKKIGGTWWFNWDDVFDRLYGSSILNKKTNTYRKK